MIKRSKRKLLLVNNCMRVFKVFWKWTKIPIQRDQYKFLKARLLLAPKVAMLTPDLRLHRFQLTKFRLLESRYLQLMVWMIFNQSLLRLSERSLVMILSIQFSRKREVSKKIQQIIIMWRSQWWSREIQLNKAFLKNTQMLMVRRSDRSLIRASHMMMEILPCLRVSRKLINYLSEPLLVNLTVRM